MKPAQAFREAAKSFGGTTFTKEELEEEYYSLVDGGRSNTNFSSYFSDFKRRSIGGLQIRQVGINLFASVTPTSSSATTPSASVVTPVATSLPLVAAEMVLSKGLSIDSTTDLVEISTSNSAIVEAQIPLGLRQTGTGTLLAKRYLPNARDLYNSIKTANGGLFPFTSREAVRQVVAKIDKDNGTLDAKNHNSQAIDFITDYIIDTRNDFWRKLNVNDATAMSLVDDIRAKINRRGFTDVKGRSYKPRSLPSKVCKYFGEFEYGSNHFYIDDSVVRKCIKKYMLKYFGIKLTNEVIKMSTYTDICGWLARIHTLCPTLSKSELDHILWYTYRK